MIVVPATVSAQSSKLTDEYQSFTLTSTTTVSYGANGVFNSKTLAAGSYTCSNSLFGDPLSGVLKSCYTSAASSSTATSTLLTAQSGTFKLSSTSVVSYGANSTLVQKTLDAGTYVCGDQLFGDPLVGVVKSCYLTSTPTSTSQLALVVAQRSSFTLTTATTVVYGVGTQTVQKPLAAGTYECSDSLFSDPAVGIVKACYVASASASAASPAVTTSVAAKPTVDTGVLAVSGDVMVNGAVSNAEYQAMAQKMGTDDAIAYRYGPSSGDYVTATQAGLPTYGKRTSQSMKMVSIQNPNGKGSRGCAWDGGWCGNWQVGGALEYDYGDYSTSVLNFGYVADAAPDASFYQKSYAAGVGTVQALAVAHNTMSVEPEPSWTRYDGPSKDGGAIDEDIQNYQKSFTLEKPVALGKCYGRGNWCTSTLAAYADGRIVSVGSNTAHNLASTQLPAGKVPTALTVTNSGEFALVTVWDTAAMRGQVAVLALGDGCQGCSMSNESSAWHENWGNWKRVYPGLPGLGNYTYMKLVGFVDLPDTLKAPTEISVSTGLSQWDYLGVRNYWQTDLDSSTVRARYLSGDLSNAYARTGVAVVVSKS
ncbi:MAG: hypothetical protein ACRYGA_18180, partial [Janthinobacterium lividum]